MSLSRYVVFFFQAEDGIRDLVRSRGLGDVYKRQAHSRCPREPKQGDGPEVTAAPRRQQVEHAEDEVLSLIHI